MITFHNGNLLESKCDVIAHQVNVQGIMGGGLARQIAIKYPSVEWIYNNFYSLIRFGNCLFAKTDDGTYIANCFSQDKEYNTIYSAICGCFRQIKNFCTQYDLKTVGVPYKYGCGIAHGEWEKVFEIFKKEFECSSVELQIWKFEGGK